jgi:N-acetylmuramoyl-L-alanine amidase
MRRIQSNKKTIIAIVATAFCAIVFAYALASNVVDSADEDNATADNRSNQIAATTETAFQTDSTRDAITSVESSTQFAVSTEEASDNDTDIASNDGSDVLNGVNDNDMLPLTGENVGIDAGHQSKGNNGKEPLAPDSSVTKAKVTSGTSGVSTGTSEHELNLAVAKKLKAILEERGAEVVMTRETDDVDISNKARAEIMNKAGVDICIRIHANGGGASESGAMMLVPKGHVSKEIEKESENAGKIIFKAYLDETGAKDIGVIPRSDMTGFNWSKVPVCLIEMGYMSNKAEDELMEADDYRKKCALGLANGIEKYLKG